MKTIKYLSTLILLFTFSMLFSQTHVSGNIENNTTWTTAGSPYVIDDDITIANGVTLTIQPGVIVKFNDFWDDIWVNGTLNAIGTSSNRIVFTSFLDDAHGGDTNGDGNATSAGPNQWSSIYYQKGSSGTLKYCTILYGGGEYSASVHIRDNNVLIDHCNISNSAERGIWIGDASPEISNCNFENNGSQGIWIEGFDGQKAFNLINNTFHNNQWAVFANLTDETNDIVLSGNNSTGTDANGFGRNGFGLVGTIAGKVSYTGQRNFPFIIWDDVIVKENAGLDISVGTTVKFNDFWDGIWIDGEMNAIGTETDSIYFTALADDSRGGDTNGDGTTTSAGPNQWSTINYSDKGGKGELRYCFVGYGGGEYSANIHANNNGVTIDHCNISFSNERGIWIGNSSPDINNCTFDNNGTQAVWIEGFDSLKTFTFTNNTFHNNQWAVFANLTDEANDIVLSGNTSTGTDANGFGRNGFGLVGTIAGKVSYTGQRNFPFIIWDDVRVKENAGLDISAGTTVKFNDFWDGIWIDGEMNAIGTETDSIYFTALADDSRGGDTNGDGAATSAGPNQWSTINYSDKGGKGELRYCFVGYGGGEYSANIHANNNGVTIDHCNISFSNERGIWIGNSSPDINNCTFDNNGTHAVWIEGFDSLKTFTFTNNTFHNNQWAVFANLTDETNDIVLSGNTSTGTDANGFGRNGFGLVGTIAGKASYTGQRNFPFIIWDDVRIKEDARLDVSAGTTVKFNDYWDGIWIDGEMNAIGTETDSIYFTALADDSRGGDTNGDGTATSAGPNQWSTINYSDKGRKGELRYCFVGYGGGVYSANVHVNNNGVTIDHCNISFSNERGIWIGNSSPDINNCTFDNNGTHAVWIEGFDSLKTFTFTNNTFHNNQWAAFANLTDETNDIVLSGNTSTGTDAKGFGRNGFGLVGTIAGKVSYTGQRNFPFIIWDDVTVKENAGLDISAGTIVKFNDYWDGINVYGAFKAVGEKNNPVVFAPVTLDCIGNDTNGPEDTTLVIPGQWSCIYFDKLSSNNVLKNAILTSGGGEWGTIIYINTDDVLIDSCQIFNSDYNGIYISEGSPEIRNSIISDNTIGISTTGGSSPKIEYNIFNKNKNFGVQNWDVTLNVNAKNNFWGSSTGPVNPNSNPEGHGDPVSDFVDFMPWLDNPAMDLTGNKPDFDFVVNGNKVSFLNKSSSSGIYVWDMGDMSNDIVNNPYHIYQKPGDYHVCLEVLGSGCFPTESVCKKVSIKGISSFLPLEVGNIGIATFDIAAGGVNDKTRFEIRDNNNTVIADSVYYYSDGTAKAMFDLSGVSLGKKDLLIVYDDGTVLPADTKLNVVQGYEAEPELEIIARGAALINVWTNYEIKITNPGNVDMFGVPVWIAFSNIPGIEAKFTNVEFTPSPYSISQGRNKNYYVDNGMDIFVDVDSIFGEATPSRVYPLYLPFIPAGQSISLKMKIKSPEDFDFQAWVNDPYFSNDLTRGPGFNGRLLGCLSSIFLDKLIKITPGIDCANTIIKSIYKPLAGLQSNSPKVFVWPSAWDYVSIGLDCGKSLFASVKMAYEITKLVVNFRNDVAAIRDCQKNFDPKKKKKKPINIVQSFDPNEKEGPAGYGVENYIPYQNKLTYTIYFENDPDSAQVPAHTVIVVDTFDLSVFDINSFEINNVTIGDSSVNGLPGAKTLAANINLSDLNVDARVMMELDTNSGVMQCRFLSLDPVSGNEIEDPFSGFLPPNISKPEGEGSVTFTIGLKENIKDGLTVNNRASIYFDANKPITTNSFINTFDLSSPKSSIVSVESLNNGKEIINIEGNDSLSGIDYYEIWYSENDSPYKLLNIVRGNIDTLEGVIGNTYKLYSVAVDNVGNKELEPTTPDVQFVMTSTDDIGLDAMWQVYPNPARDYITLTIGLKNSENISVDIYNQLGSKVKNIFTGKINTGIWQKQINIEDLESGLYFINCQINGQKMINKLVIQ